VHIAEDEHYYYIYFGNIVFSQGLYQTPIGGAGGGEYKVYCHCGDRYIGKYFVAMVDD
jgi:hypothetical protein